MTDFGAAAAVGTVGGANGKVVSDGVSAIAGKVNEHTVKAADKDKEKDKETPAAKQAPAAALTGNAAHTADTSVPAPPSGRAPARKAAAGPVALDTLLNNAPQVPFAPFTLADALPAKPLSPPPVMTPESFRHVSMGMRRADVLKLGDPSSRVAMFDDGHMVETFSYRAAGERFGRLQLQDGTVVKIEAK